MLVCLLVRFFVHAFFYSFIILFIYSFINFVLSLVCSFVRSFYFYFCRSFFSSSTIVSLFRSLSPCHCPFIIRNIFPSPPRIFASSSSSYFCPIFLVQRFITITDDSSLQWTVRVRQGSWGWKMEFTFLRREYGSRQCHHDDDARHSDARDRGKKNSSIGIHLHGRKTYETSRVRRWWVAKKTKEGRTGNREEMEGWEDEKGGGEEVQAEGWCMAGRNK